MIVTFDFKIEMSEFLLLIKCNEYLEKLYYIIASEYKKRVTFYILLKSTHTGTHVFVSILITILINNITFLSKIRNFFLIFISLFIFFHQIRLFGTIRYKLYL
jgi:hypothetical protein